MKKDSSTYELIQTYFRLKTEQLIAVSNQAVVEHSSLKGTHRENLIDIYLSEILPKRFAISKGMVYGLINKSKESDLVIWDEQNFPSLKLLGHSMFFVESVKAILEIKTKWSSKEFSDIKNKKTASFEIHRSPQTPNLDDRVNFLENRIDAIENDKQIDTIFSIPVNIPFAAFIFQGGEKFSIETINKKELAKVHKSYPDLMILLKAGKVLEKQYIFDEEDLSKGYAYLRLHNAGENALLIFTSLLLEKLMINTNLSEYPVNFIKYGPPFYQHDIETVEFLVDGQFPGTFGASKIGSLK